MLLFFSAFKVSTLKINEVALITQVLKLIFPSKEFLEIYGLKPLRHVTSRLPETFPSSNVLLNIPMTLIELINLYLLSVNENFKN